MTRGRRNLLLAFCCGVAMATAACGDGDVCGAYNTGNVIIVDRCDFATVTPQPAGDTAPD